MIETRNGVLGFVTREQQLCQRYPCLTTRIVEYDVHIYLREGTSSTVHHDFTLIRITLASETLGTHLFKFFQALVTRNKILVVRSCAPPIYLRVGRVCTQLRCPHRALEVKMEEWRVQ